MATDWPIDGVDQTDVLLGKSATGNRESMLSFIGPDLVAARWKQWRVYFTEVSDRSRDAATARHVLLERALGGIPAPVRHRDEPFRGHQRRKFPLGDGARAQGRRAV